MLTCISRANQGPTIQEEGHREGGKESEPDTSEAYTPRNAVKFDKPFKTQSFQKASIKERTLNY